MDEVKPVGPALREDGVQAARRVLGDVGLRVVARGSDRNAGAEGRAILAPDPRPPLGVPASRKRPDGPPARRG